jgi:hypothetical protein
MGTAGDDPCRASTPTGGETEDFARLEIEEPIFVDDCQLLKFAFDFSS